MLPILMVCATIGSGLVGGLFFAFSTFLMQAFDRLPARAAISAMQSINATILNPLFFLLFFGTGGVSVGLLAAAAGWFPEAWPRPARALVGLGALAYLAGPILVTIVFNVPLNDRLAVVSAEDDQGHAWRRYRRAWTFWNHVRTLAALVSATAFALAGQVFG